MRSTSRKRKSHALFLAVILFRSAVGTPSAPAGTLPEPCILLKMSDSSIPDDMAKDRLNALQLQLGKGLHVEWVPPPEPIVEPGQEAGDRFPLADEKGLATISASLREALRHMDRMETEEAARKLSEAESLARSFRLGETTKPYLAEVFLRRGILLLWEGEPGKAEEMLARSRQLRPDFIPDPALFSPPFMEAWKRSAERPPPQAELLVTSLPPGARIHRNGEEAGTTPGRVRVSGAGPVRIQVHAEGYLRSVRIGQWLPGDFETLEFPLVRDRNAALAETLSSSPDGREAGPLLSRMLAETGARRAGVLLLEAGQERPVLRVLTQTQGEDVPVMLGTVEWPEGKESGERVAATATEMLKDAGWPAQPGKDTERGAWYHKWWVWALIGVATVGIATGIGGGGGGGASGSSTGTIGVNF